MKWQNENGRIFVSRLVDPCKMIYPGGCNILAVLRQNKMTLMGNNKVFENSFPQVFIFSPNSACTMGFWRFQGLVNVVQPRAVPGHAKSWKKPWVFKLFQKRWCWRSSFGLHLFIFSRMLHLICLFWLQNLVWPHNSASSVTWRPRELRRLPKASQKEF